MYDSRDDMHDPDNDRHHPVVLKVADFMVSQAWPLTWVSWVLFLVLLWFSVPRQR